MTVYGRFREGLAQVIVAGGLVISTRRESGFGKKNDNPYEIKPSSPVLPLNVAPVPFPGRAILGSFLVMLAWPMLGIGACLALSILEKASEASLMFGGVTLIFLLPLGLVVSSEWIFGALIGIVWVLALVVPLWFSWRSIQAKFSRATIFACQSLFSAIQAALGFLMILGKQI